MLGAGLEDQVDLIGTHIFFNEAKREIGGVRLLEQTRLGARRPARQLRPFSRAEAQGTDDCAGFRPQRHAIEGAAHDQHLLPLDLSTAQLERRARSSGPPGTTGERHEHDP